MSTLECNCGAEPFPERDFYNDDESTFCGECGRECSIVIDDVEYDEDGVGTGTAHVWTHEANIIDAGQPVCDGSWCRASDCWLQQKLRCTLDCDRVTPECKERARLLILESSK